jgi:hypothetical protein
LFWHRLRPRGGACCFECQPADTGRLGCGADLVDKGDSGTTRNGGSDRSDSRWKCDCWRGGSERSRSPRVTEGSKRTYRRGRKEACAPVKAISGSRCDCLSEHRDHGPFGDDGGRANTNRNHESDPHGSFIFCSPVNRCRSSIYERVACDRGRDDRSSTNVGFAQSRASSTGHGRVPSCGTGSFCH